MKKTYITPISKRICLDAESCLLTGSDDPNTTTGEVGDVGEYSNRRGNGIWGNTEW